MNIVQARHPAGGTPNAIAIRKLEHNDWFVSLLPEVKQEILQRSTVRHYAAGALVYAVGSTPSGFYMVLSGEVRLEHVTEGGNFAFYKSLGVGDMFGLLSEIDGTTRFSDARAWGPTKLLHLPHAGFRDLYRTHPAARESFVNYLCRTLHTTLNALVETQSAPPRMQIANILVRAFRRETLDGRETPKLTQEAIAAMAGVSRQTASKVLHEFRAAGLIRMQYGSVTLRDLSRLLALTQG